MSFYTPAALMYLLSHIVTAIFVILIKKYSFVSWHIVSTGEDPLIFDVTLKSNIFQNGQIHGLESAAIDFLQS
uniref:Uncharacterized protein n=1 Tax=Leersia perrieri TaxID=77586 RepID=A0A0D9VGZ9_9ORYZ